MRCSKCKYEFCWECLGHYPGYRHTQNLACPFRYVSLVLLTLLLSIMANFKLSYNNNDVLAFEKTALYVILAVVLIDCWAVTWLFHVVIFEDKKHLKR